MGCLHSKGFDRTFEETVGKERKQSSESNPSSCGDDFTDPKCPELQLNGLFIDTTNISSTGPTYPLQYSSSTPSLATRTPRYAPTRRSTGTRGSTPVPWEIAGVPDLSNSTVEFRQNLEATEAYEAFYDGWSGGHDTQTIEVHDMIIRILNDYSRNRANGERASISIYVDGSQSPNGVLVGDSGMRGISTMLERNCSLGTLEIVHDRITLLGAEHIGRGLAHSTMISVLNLSHNPLEDAGVEALMRGCSSWTGSLHVLKLCNVNMRDQGCMKVAHCFLSERVGLTCLDISSNSISQVGIDCLSHCLAAYDKLLDLELLIYPPDMNGDAIEPAPERVNLGVAVIDKALNRQRISTNDIQSIIVPISKDMEDVSPCSSETAVSVPEELPTVEVEKLHVDMTKKSLTSPLKIGCAETCGKRPQMEDMMLLRSPFRESTGEHLFAVFDGHGGVECARFIRANFASVFEEELEQLAVRRADSCCISAETVNDDDATDAVERSLLNTFARLNSFCTEFKIPHGTCAVITYIYGSQIFTACVGDSQSIMCLTKDTGMEYEILSKVIKPSDPAELQRIHDCNGFVSDKGKINGVIAVSRALGDIELQPYVTWQPTLQKSALKIGKSLIALASDGVWGVMSPSHAAELVNGIENPAEASRTLCQSAFDSGSHDNITVICIRLNIPEVV
eukprot:CAMPEP_0184014730 /NCGR_PEP_ID=MMETSP0954-20121128/5868_1 /TAXON_ID=627963 /ORGANISM="Aplanochytrium sp, Strain PBS07" /LENGTH=678 /DNA_ID=CAMNT_0026295337 /DNA_START=468 /DNA_END=2501 /DNA_ORIENTATION=+